MTDSNPSRAAHREAGSAEDRAAVWAALCDIYAGFTAHDRERIDRRIHPEATIWDSAVTPLLFGRADLDWVRAQRPTGEGAPVVAGIHAHDEVIDVWEDTALARYLLRVDFAPAADGTTAAPERIRNTAVVRRFPQGWLVVHNHEDLLP
ncbi:DUF4440 domain-containing protein [Embleya sp. NBC_00896]|uniref:DUF4440 domain-containing protein n=1 Tax=Embleya sp. NBC_00896 TaxID=2975961 RepID=UPI002F9183AF|nr:DUF4440 domain-containing protein [Embleya sp. NBC_00896]